MIKRELRTLGFDASDLSFDDKGLKVSGYVNKAGSVSQVLSNDDLPFKETIDPQAFIDALSLIDHPIDFYAEHDPKNLLATTANDSLKLRADETGLHMEAQIINTTICRDTYEMIKSGVIRNMSFGFIVTNDSWDHNTNDDVPLRTVNSMELYEVSAVRFPAYLDSSIGTRSKQEIKDMEQRGINNISDAVSLNEEVQDVAKELRDYSLEELQAEIEERSKEAESEDTKIDTEKSEDSEKVEEKRSDNVEAHISAEDIRSIASAVVAEIGEQRRLEAEKTETEQRDDDTDSDLETDSAKSAGCKTSEKRDDEEDGKEEAGSTKETKSDKETEKTSEDEKESTKETDSEKRSITNELKELFNLEN